MGKQIFFTSDLHLGHVNVLEFKNRPFSDLDQMNQTLIDNINERVDRENELWILGDFAYKVSREEVRRLRNQIKCRHVHLVSGNHDKDYSQDHIFQSVQSYKELKTVFGKFVLFHYPIQEWAAAHYGSVHLHGHLHSTGEYNQENRSKLFKDRLPCGHIPKKDDLPLRIYDVGVDANGFRPVSLTEIADWFGLQEISNTNAKKCQWV